MRGAMGGMVMMGREGPSEWTTRSRTAGLLNCIAMQWQRNNGDAIGQCQVYSSVGPLDDYITNERNSRLKSSSSIEDTVCCVLSSPTMERHLRVRYAVLARACQPHNHDV